MLNAKEILGCVSKTVDRNGRYGYRLLGLVGCGAFTQRLEVFTNAVKALENGCQSCVLLGLRGGFCNRTDGRHYLLDTVKHRLHFRLLLIILFCFFLGLEVVLERSLVLFLVFCHDGIELFLCEWLLVVDLLLKVQKFNHGHELFFEIHKLNFF